MTRPNSLQLARARRMLALEGGCRGEEADAAGRVYDKLRARMAPLVGAAGVGILFERSVQVARAEFPCLAAPGCLDGAVQLRACLQSEAPEVAGEAAASLFGTLIAILTTLLGD